ncbi:DUF6193 family natural product biosynthesis protein [Streptomyces sp. NBC_00287]|uniref:DUF6193 family natural product biosynthesis protein n=1 Tax=Streptomyces sp. NBC_00287 TaxID=2975702 RepID=UPI002E28A4FC|nr:DUF6193 family natural product biosynthesis protein [Streptomyces sp. NBC_00287]
MEFVRRLEGIAREHGIDLGELRAVSGPDAGAETPAERGTVLVFPRAVDNFHVRIQLRRTFALSEGWTDDLVTVMGVVGLWRQGCRLRELHDRFPFMSWSELAQGFEDGDPVPAKWRELLSSDWHSADRPLLRAAHDHPELRRFYPDISHHSLMLSGNPFEHDLESGLAKITPLSEDEDHYRVSVLPTGVLREVASLTEALEVAAAGFRSLEGA